MSQEDKDKKELIETIIIASTKIMEKAGYDKTTNGILTAINGNLATVKMKDESYTCEILQGAEISVGDVVKIIYPQNNSSNKLILGKSGTVGTGGGSSSGGSETVTTLGTLINNATEKAIPVNADMLPLMDSDSSNVVKKLSWANIKTTLKTYFDGLYATISHTHTTSNITDFSTNVSNNTDVSANTSARHTHGNKTILDNVTASYTTDEKYKLSGIASGAEVNVNPDWNAVSGDTQILNKPIIPIDTNQLTKTDVYTKTEIDNKISAIYKYRGSVATYSVLPSSGQVIGDVYNTEETGKNYAWNGTLWDDIGGIEALATLTNNGLITKEDFSKLSGIANNATQNDTDANLKNRANHTGTQSADTIVDGTTNKVLSATSKTNYDSAVATSHTHSNKTILDAYTQTEVNLADAVSKKHSHSGDDSSHYHTTDRNRANHTGTQVASTISDFASTVRATVLTGLSTSTNAVITATDSILTALGKLQKQVSDNLTTLANHTSNTNNPHSVTVAQLGLSTQSVKAVKMTNQSIASSSLVTVSFDSKEFDTNSMHDNSTNNSRLTCKVAGIYLCTLQIDFDSNTTGSRAIQITKNGTINITSTQVDACNFGNSVVIVVGVCQMVVNDYIEGGAYQSSGGGLNVNGNVLGTFLTMTKIG